MADWRRRQIVPASTRNGRRRCARRASTRRGAQFGQGRGLRRRDRAAGRVPPARGGAAALSAAPGRIGPNALLQLAPVLERHGGAALREAVFSGGRRAGAGATGRADPRRSVADVHQAMRAAGAGPRAGAGARGGRGDGGLHPGASHSAPGAGGAEGAALRSGGADPGAGDRAQCVDLRGFGAVLGRGACDGGRAGCRTPRAPRGYFRPRRSRWPCSRSPTIRWYGASGRRCRSVTGTPRCSVGCSRCWSTPA